jgi:beta-lactamase regulating signal transducer with metallopeptidase domain
MFGKRKALIGYLAFWAGRRVAERVVRKELRKRLAALVEPQRPKRRRRLPLIGAAVAVAAAGAVVVSRLRR